MFSGSWQKFVKVEGVECWKKFLELCRKDQEAVFQYIVTYDTNMIKYYYSTCKRDSMEQHWKREPVPKEFNIIQSTKIIAKIVSDCNRIFLIDFKRHRYKRGLLQRFTTAAAREYCRKGGKISQSMLLLHNIAPIDTIALSKYTVKDCGFSTINQTPYSPGLALVYFLFRK